MFSVIVIVFEAIAILFISIFARTNLSTTLTSTYFSLAGDCFSLMLAFTLMYTPFRRLSLSSLSILLIIVAVTVQTNLLFDTFWSSCFNGFQSNYQVTISLIIRCLFGSLAVLLTALDFIGLFGYWQVFFIMAPIMGIGYTLNQAIIIYGLKTFDGGGGMMIFLYSGVCSFMIWVLCIRGKIQPNRYKIKESYINQTLSFIGVMIAFANWPKFNMGGALATSYNLVDTSTVTTVAYLQNSAISNTFLGLSAAILTSILFSSKDTKEDKLKFKCYIDCFINGGIVIACYQDISLNPSPCIIMGCFSAIITVIVHKYFVTASESESESMFKTMMKNYSKIIFRILFAFFSSIIGSIVVATRSGNSPQLLVNEYSKTAGLQIVAFLIVLGIGLVFGAITGVLINLIMSRKSKDKEEQGQEQKKIGEEIADFDFFDGLFDDMHPLYYDIFEQINNKQEQKINLADYTTMVIKQALLGAQDNPLRMVTVSKPFQTRVEPSKSNVIDKESDKQDQGKIIINQPLTAQKSKLKVSEAQKIPAQDKNVARRLNYEDAGSDIQDERRGVSIVRR